MPEKIATIHDMLSLQHLSITAEMSGPNPFEIANGNCRCPDLSVSVKPPSRFFRVRSRSVAPFYGLVVRSIRTVRLCGKSCANAWGGHQMTSPGAWQLVRAVHYAVRHAG